MIVSKDGICAVMVPEWSKHWGFYPDENKVWFGERMHEKGELRALPPGKHEIIGLYKPDKPLSEEECARLVKYLDTFDAYWDYSMSNEEAQNIWGGQWKFKTATESLSSWMKANEVYVTNPYGMVEPECGITCGCAESCYQKSGWRKAQSRTGTWLFLKKIES